ncbi:ABC transporter substrate-binding protein [Mesorhizobium sp. L-8-10]|uniref:ABC transporter substrate-binding protein n=1 Tax=unclassified Mesorhizobium TaxID=325217 RepID=UPI00193798A9|nr:MULTISPECIES: ABC transporter substrate-binding protein [unclassified Mesorhizobium]BCH25365.1 ABC transporter substrate-binding protein [Mesorhizobium sp. L-8-3]BCH33374.1 ABC transporter substrate-binding protein [Mesorhizobium sp. L-8-10]
MKSLRRLFASALLSSACIAASGHATSAADDISLRLPWLLNVQSAGYIMAKNKGFYDEAGLNVEIMPGGPNLNSTALVASGANTFGTNDVGQIALGAANGMDLVMVAACFQRHAGGVIALASSDIKEPADLAGKKLAYNEGGPWVLTKAMLAKAGVPLDQISLVVSPSSELLMNGSVDAKTGFAINEAVAIELKGKKTSVILPSDYGVSAYLEVVFTTRKTVEENPDLVKRFVAATKKGYDYAYQHKDETVATVVALNNQLDPVQQTAQLALQESYVYTDYSRKNGTCSFDPAVVKETVETLREFGGLKGDLDVDKLYSTEFIAAR